MKSIYEFTSKGEYNEYCRYYFAGLAMQGLLSNPAFNYHDKSLPQQQIAECAAIYADELLKQLAHE